MPLLSFHDDVREIKTAEFARKLNILWKFGMSSWGQCIQNIGQSYHSCTSGSADALEKTLQKTIYQQNGGTKNKVEERK